MSRSKHIEAQMISALNQIVGWTADDAAYEVGVFKHMLYAWKAKYCGMDMRNTSSNYAMRTTDCASW